MSRCRGEGALFPCLATEFLTVPGLEPVHFATLAAVMFTCF